MQHPLTVGEHRGRPGIGQQMGLSILWNIRCPAPFRGRRVPQRCAPDPPSWTGSLFGWSVEKEQEETTRERRRQNVEENLPLNMKLSKN